MKFDHGELVCPAFRINDVNKGIARVETPNRTRRAFLFLQQIAPRQCGSASQDVGCECHPCAGGNAGVAAHNGVGRQRGRCIGANDQGGGEARAAEFKWGRWYDRCGGQPGNGVGDAQAHEHDTSNHG